MRVKMDVFLTFCFIFWLINQAEAQIARCDYRYRYHWTTGNKITNGSYYTCNLNTGQANYNEKLIRIDGQHETGHSNTDVKWISNYVDHKLKTFSSIFCQNYPKLEIITINGAELELVDDDSLSNCKNLDHLFIDENKIRDLPEYLLTRNSKLSLLWIYKNQLTTLPENFFLTQRNLEQLYLYENQINFLPTNIFRPLVNLEVLYLDNNKLQSIHPEWFVNLQNLKQLDLNKNQISEIPSKCFASLRSLEKLFLHKNKIKDLNSNNFDGLQNLHVLYVGKNEISDLPVGVFTPLKRLQELSLENNKLTTIHSDSFGVHSQLTEVNFYYNKINAIDEKFIDNAAVSLVNMKNNICTHSFSQNRAEVRNNLRSCFANYQSRSIQFPSSCGRSTILQGTVIGGTKIKRNSYPWIAALLRPSGKLFCGGTLVSSRKVLTAAHCIQDKGLSQPLLPRSVIVLLGFHDLSDSFEIGRGSYAVQSIHIHPDWNPYTTSYDADIAVLMLYRDVTFNDHIQPICMTSIDPRITALTEAYVVGNGKGGHDNEYENIPKILKMPIQTYRDCTEKDSTFATLLTGRTFCAGSGTGQGVCSGDSGSGFVVEIGNVFYLRGIVSASLFNSYLGCDVDSYSLFTDAIKFTNWISELSTAN